MRPDLIATCQMFLVPSSILFAAMGVGPTTEGLKTGISVVGFVTAFMWCVQMIGWKELTALERFTTVGLSLTFVAVWFVSASVHGAKHTGNEA